MTNSFSDSWEYFLHGIFPVSLAVTAETNQSFCLSVKNQTATVVTQRLLPQRSLCSRLRAAALSASGPAGRRLDAKINTARFCVRTRHRLILPATAIVEMRLVSLSVKPLGALSRRLAKAQK